MLHSIMAIGDTASMTWDTLVLCTLFSLLLGLGSAYLYMFRNSYSKSFVMTLVSLPAIIQLVIMLVNGNLGTGVAVMGAFSLVRFRSAPGSAREISAIFLSMAIGLATGTGCLGIALLFFVLMAGTTILLTITKFGEPKNSDKTLRITVPEDLDYISIFDDVFPKYANRAHLTKVKTTNMGSLFELQYEISLKNGQSEKKMIDEIRCRNGNLPIICGLSFGGSDEL